MFVCVVRAVWKIFKKQLDVLKLHGKCGQRYLSYETSGCHGYCQGTST